MSILSVPLTVQKIISASFRLMRFDYPIGTFLLLWPTLWALWIAGNGHPPAKIVLIFVLGVYVMRAAGCVINDFADRNFDGQVARTQTRPLATGELSVFHAGFVFAGLMLLALVLVLQLNPESLWVALIAAGLATLYPFTKRFTYLPQLVLGLAFSMTIAMAFTALQGGVSRLAILLWLANFFWVVAYDTIYAMVDREDDLKMGIKSTAILFGRFDRLIVLLLGAVSLSILGLIGYEQHYSVYYTLGLILALSNLLYQQWLLKAGSNERRFLAFLSNNWFGAFIFAGLLLHYLN